VTVKENRDGKEVEKELDCNLLLDNFTYDRLAGDRSWDPDLRKEWLKRQPREHLDKNFRSQPFEQLVKVLRTMGHNKATDDRRSAGTFGKQSYGGLGGYYGPLQ
jgi:hypothetical protein